MFFDHFLTARTNQPNNEIEKIPQSLNEGCCNLHEEDGSVVSGHVPVALLSVELDGETTGIAGSIGGTLLASDGGETGEERSALADTVQELGLGVLGDVVGDLEVTVGSSTLGVDNTLGDTLAVKVGQLVD